MKRNCREAAKFLKFDTGFLGQNPCQCTIFLDLAQIFWAWHSVWHNVFWPAKHILEADFASKATIFRKNFAASRRLHSKHTINCMFQVPVSVYISPIWIPWHKNCSIGAYIRAWAECHSDLSSFRRHQKLAILMHIGRLWNKNIRMSAQCVRLGQRAPNNVQISTCTRK